MELFPSIIFILLKQQELEIFQKVKAVVMFAFAEAILFGLCITGKSFDDMVRTIFCTMKCKPNQ